MGSRNALTLCMSVLSQRLGLTWSRSVNMMCSARGTAKLPLTFMRVSLAFTDRKGQSKYSRRLDVGVNKLGTCKRLPRLQE
ncbi:hypothetical protein CC78DRAFT_528306 [Lojkania enalia]|uniref:Secreted protein n=1 Tax=Lojkania enalia TaxID=147567 RepID=A0A9P4NC66_9PLEO|nr:hypothetical protein CC78DRAFT_528306 [Didymosphaeria enalia]